MRRYYEFLRNFDWRKRRIIVPLPRPAANIAGTLSWTTDGGNDFSKMTPFQVRKAVFPECSHNKEACLQVGTADIKRLAAAWMDCVVT